MIDRDKTAAARDAVADEIDATAENRDLRSEARDQRAEARDETGGRPDGNATSDRSAARRDRKSAAGDRRHAGDDREAAATDRRIAAAESSSLVIDDLTGTYDMPLAAARQRFERVDVDLAISGDGSVSIGLVQLETGEDLEDLIRRADEAMYAGKEASD